MTSRPLSRLALVLRSPIVRVALVTALLTLALAAPAFARDPGRWQLSGYRSVPVACWQGAGGGWARAAALRVLRAGPAQRRQSLRHRLDRRRRPRHAGAALLRQARPGRDPEGDVGRVLARRPPALDQQRLRPARLPRRRRDRRQ